MSKTPSPTKGPVDLTKCCKSTFTLTFAIEILGIEVWTDCSEGWLETGLPVQGIRLQYQLYPGQNYDIDVVIWPQVAKIWAGGQSSCWVRTWQLLERRWLTFSIRHAFPVRVEGLQTFVASVTPILGLVSLSSNAKNEKSSEVLIPGLEFGQRRYFGPVLEAEASLERFVRELIWGAVVEYIPSSYLDGSFDVPQIVTDVRHQDKCLDIIKYNTLNRKSSIAIDLVTQISDVKPKTKNESKLDKDKDKDKKKMVEEKNKTKFEITLSGDCILAGAGRIVQFETAGDRPPDLGEIIVLISTNNLPAQDDYPIVFVNVTNLHDIPVNDFQSVRITHLYTRWKIGDEEHNSQTLPLGSKTEMNFNDHHAILLPYELVMEITSRFLDNAYEIQVRGIKIPKKGSEPKLFGYEIGDRDFGTKFIPRHIEEELDVLIAVTKIHAQTLGKGFNAVLNGEYPLYPPSVSVQQMDRESVCTNDVNAIKRPVKPVLVVKPDVILLAQMTLDVCMGIVGCKPRQLASSFSRMFCLVRDSDALGPLLKCVSETNLDILESGAIENLLTGFAIDTGDVVIFYLEGPKECEILRIWEMTEDLYPDIKPKFSSTVRYPDRLYPEFLAGTVPFNILKMFVPLGVLLACPPVYARPTLPLPTRSALLKIGRLLTAKMKTIPLRNDMPTANELKSFSLELCVAPRPVSLLTNKTQINEEKCENLDCLKEQETSFNEYYIYIWGNYDRQALDHRLPDGKQCSDLQPSIFLILDVKIILINVKP